MSCQRDYKHIDNLDKVFIVDNIRRKIVNELREYFDFNEQNYL
jgi:hypothetical protein